MNYIFNNVRIIDGAGTKSYVGNVGVFNGKIVLDNIPKTADKIIDCTNKCLAPGFIDSHSHGDLVIGGGDYGDLCKVNQGVTLQIAGQCGNSCAPYLDPSLQSQLGHPEEMKKSYLTEQTKWDKWSKYVDYLRSIKHVTNYKLLSFFVAHNICSNRIIS